MKLSEQAKKDAENFKDTLLYLEMMDEIERLKLDAEHYKSVYESEADSLARLRSDVKHHLDCKDGKIVPIPKDEEAIAKLQQDYDREKAKADRQKKEILRLRNQLNDLLYELHPEDKPEDLSEKPHIRPVGRPTVGSQAEYLEAKEMRRNGYSVAEIAQYMEWSVGFTQKKTKGVKVDAEKRKKHMAERRKAAKVSAKG